MVYLLYVEILQLVGMVDGMRTGRDYGEGRPLYGPGKWYYPATYIINKPDHWQGHRAATEAMATNFFTHRKLFVNDSGNVLTLDQPIPLCEAQIVATIFGPPSVLPVANMVPGLIAPRVPFAPNTTSSVWAAS